MVQMWKEFWNDEEGSMVVEILLVLAVLVAIALIFRKQLMSWVNDLIAKIFSDDVKNDAVDGLPGTTE